ncbi:class I SAM-dependent methyltransferase [Arenibaculum sp.]|uniref:SAM-dependent methyltransferase n=1 Tax=Arenibaculum sp. TaxID=2865862 RepID=UPI002E129182|nr:class I SAM-dependent methyltransferase [Arenibaculum sp.]
MSVEQEVARHYTHGALERAILDALAASGKDVDGLSAADLSAADEFHLGWRAATLELAKDLDLQPGMHVLDVGSGIGGPARTFAEMHGCRVTGIDLTQEFVDVANALTRRCGLADLVSFRQVSALSLPFADGSFDAATLIHVGMNVEDKAALFAEVRRALKPGARFAVYDVVRLADGDLPYPMPWAATAGTSFVEPADAYRRKLAAAGFELEAEVDRSALALELGREMREKAARQGVPPLGLHVLMGPASPERLSNVMGALGRGIIGPVEFLVRAA